MFVSTINSILCVQCLAKLSQQTATRFSLNKVISWFTVKLTHVTLVNSADFQQNQIIPCVTHVRLSAVCVYMNVCNTFVSAGWLVMELSYCEAARRK